MKKFQNIEFEIVKFDEEDVIRTSSGELDNLYGLYGNEWQDGEQ